MRVTFLPTKTPALVVVAGLLGVLGGCVPPAEVPNARAVLETDEFSASLDVVGPLMIDNPLFGITDNFRLVTHIDKRTRAVTHVIEVEIDHEGEFFNFRYAADDTGTPLPLVPVKRQRNVFGVNRTELVDVIVSEAALRAHAASGYRVQLSARDGTYYVIALTPAMIAAQFDEVAQVLGSTAVAGLAQPLAVGAAAAAPTGPTLGISYMPLSASKIVTTLPDGLFILSVTPDSAAARAGVKPGDILVSFDGIPLPDPAAARGIIAAAKPGSVAKLVIQRGKDRLTLEVQL